MAKLPEVYAEEKARKAMERAEKLEKTRAERAQQKLENMPTDDELRKQAEKQAQIEKNFKEARVKVSEKKTQIRVTNTNIHIPKTNGTNIKITGEVEYNQIPKDQKRVKACSDTPRKLKSGKEGKTTKKTVRLTEKQREYYNKQNELFEKYFYAGNITPKYNLYVCSCCGKPKPIEEFHKSYSFGNGARCDEAYQFHQPICKQCSQKLFFFHYYNNGKNELEAIEHWCCDTNTYWSEDMYLEARRVYDNNPTSNCIVPDYVAAIGRRRSSILGKTYWDSPSVQNRVYTDTNSDPEKKLLKDSNNNIIGEFKAPLHWDKEQVKLRKKMINLLRYDPFELYPEEEARNMYYDLDLMIDDTMQEDLLKLKAAVEIVCSLHEIEKLRQKQVELENNEASAADIKALVERRNSELRQITTFAKDNGFAERYAMNKAKGAGTLTGTMNEMREKDYEEGLVDFYGVQTCKEMQEVANMSFKAIFDQIAATDNEAWGMVQKQTEKIRKLQKELLDLKEELRRKEIEIKRNELTNKARQMKLEIEEEDEEESLDNKAEEESIEEKVPEIDNEEEEYLSKIKNGEIDNEFSEEDYDEEEYEIDEDSEDELGGEADD